MTDNNKPKASYPKHYPKDAQVIASIMQDMGINDYEPKVINQLLEFTYRYVSSILDDSKVYANHSKKKVIDVDDVKLAFKLRLDRTFTNPPSREVLIELAKEKNSINLPLIKPASGLMLPPDRFCLIGTNYRLKSPARKNPKYGLGNSSIFGNHNKSHRTLATVKRPGSFSANSKSNASLSKPVYKYCPSSNTNTNTNNTNTQTTSNQNQSQAKVEDGDIPVKATNGNHFSVP
ncbi:hypothetical protein TKK_0014875 [Trichogramma kaykai]|uniref:Transcription initiation factor TFIID subunit 9 n=1 Tax=Trichogramma kaykai TaxID=54128 RepID=A0ABD2WBG6_9HYME